MDALGGPARRGAVRPFVGRDREVADLVAGLEDAIAGRMRLLLIAGEPGTGKTWLAEHLAGLAAARGAQVVWVRCWEAGGAPPFWPWTQLLRALAEDLDDQALAARLLAGAAQVAQLVPGLAERLGAAVPPAPPPPAAAARLSLFEAVNGFLRRSAAERPLVLVMEDLQAADDASLLLLEFLVRDARGARLLVVGTYRNVTADRVHGIGDAMGQLVREGHLLRLQGLDGQEVRELVEALAGKAPSAAMAAAVHEATEGNPLFVRETVRLLATDVTLEALAGSGCRFSHSLIREVLYERLPLPARMDLHRRVGEAIERQHGTSLGAHVTELAHHFAAAAAAGDAAKALAYARQAGERALGMHAYEEAAAQYRRALQTLRLAGPDAPVRCDLLLRLAEALVRAGRYGEAEAHCLEAAELARRLGSTEQLADAALVLGRRDVRGGEVDRRLVGLLREALDGLPPADSPLRARLLARLSLELTFSDEPEVTEPIGREAVELARRLGDAPSLSAALRARWMAVWGPDGLEERAGLAEETLRLARATGDPELELAGRVRRVTSSLQSGDVGGVEADIAACARLADELRMPSHRWTATTMRAMWALLRGALDEAETLAEQARAAQPDGPNAFFAYNDQLEMLRWFQGRPHELSQARRQEVARFPRFVYARVSVSLTDADLGDAATARRLLRLLADELPGRPRDGLWLPAAAVAALAAARLRDPVAAARLYQALAPYRDQVVVGTMPHPVACFGSASLYLGLLAAVSSRWAEAGDHFEAAVAVNDRLGAAPLLARARYELARMLLARGRAGDRVRAAELLERALAGAAAIGMAGVVAGARSLRTGGQVAPPEDAASTFRREGEYWTVAYERTVVRLKDSKGLRHLARLLAHPGREFHAVDLEAPTAARPGRGRWPATASWRCAPTSGTPGRCWTPPPRPPTRPGWPSCGPRPRRPRAATTPPGPPRQGTSWNSWWPSWPGRSGGAAGTAGRPRTPSGPG